MGVGRMVASDRSSSTPPPAGGARGERCQTPMTMADQAHPAAGRKPLDEPGEVVSRHERTPALSLASRTRFG